MKNFFKEKKLFKNDHPEAKKEFKREEEAFLKNLQKKNAQGRRVSGKILPK